MFLVFPLVFRGKAIVYRQQYTHKLGFHTCKSYRTDFMSFLEVQPWSNMPKSSPQIRPQACLTHVVVF